MKKILFSFCLFFFFYQSYSQNNMELSDKQIIKTRVFNQTIDSLWWRWTTHEGLLTFFGKDNKIELVPGGAFEIYFLIDSPAGLRGSENCKILSFLPGEFLSFSWNAPPGFDDVRNSEYKTWVVVGFNKISDHKSEVKITHLGWPVDDRWDPVYDYFNKAWDMVLDKLAKYNKPDDGQILSKVTGLGGIFFKSKDPEKLKEWYSKNLGLKTDEYGSGFEWIPVSGKIKKGFTQWSPFADETKYFEPSEKEFMLNYRVENMDFLVEQLKKDGIILLDDIETYEYGKFVHIMDIEGNKIELWEPFNWEFDENATK